MSQLGFASSIWTVTRKDLLIEFKTRGAFVSVAAFSMLGIITFFFAWDGRYVSPAVFAPGVLWVIFIFSGLLAVQRSFAIEQADRAIDGLLLAPIDREALFLGKVVANVIFVFAVQLFAIPAIVIFYNLPISLSLFCVLGVGLLAAIGLASVGTLFASMVVNTRLAELLLPLLSLPFFVPIVISASNATVQLLSDGPAAGAGVWVWTKALIAFDLVFLVACTLAFPYTLEE